MKYLVLLLALAGCATEPKMCWSPTEKASGELEMDKASCQATGDAAMEFYTGGRYAAIAAQRRFNLCMKGKGYRLAECRAEASIR